MTAGILQQLDHGLTEQRLTRDDDDRIDPTELEAPPEHLGPAPHEIGAFERQAIEVRRFGPRHALARGGAGEEEHSSTRRRICVAASRIRRNASPRASAEWSRPSASSALAEDEGERGADLVGGLLEEALILRLRLLESSEQRIEPDRQPVQLVWRVPDGKPAVERVGRDLADGVGEVTHSA